MSRKQDEKTIHVQADQEQVKVEAEALYYRARSAVAEALGGVLIGIPRTVSYIGAMQAIISQDQGHRIVQHSSWHNLYWFCYIE